MAGSNPIWDITVRAPGRINLIGEHTDYNDGFVLPAAVDKSIVARLRKLEKGTHCRIRAINLDESFSFELEDLSPQPRGWSNYITGVVHELQQKGAAIGPFEAEFSGDIPIGSGMSSSAALECSFAFGLNALFGLGFGKMELIRMAQLAEHHFVGTRCGIMDQFASVMGREGHVLQLDCRSLAYEYFPLELADHELLLLDTGVHHTLAASEYNTRRSECEEGVGLLKKSLPDIRALRDVSMEQLQTHRAQLPGTVYRRCLHVVTENDRVLAATEALKGGDLPELGRLMFASHRSLAEDYAVSCPELDLLVELAHHSGAVAGARMMGGGFGGCTINLVHRAQAEDFLSTSKDAYFQRFGLACKAYRVSVASGVSITG